MADGSGISQTSLELLLEFDGTYDDTSVNNRDQSPVLGAASYASDGAVGQAAIFSYGAQNHIDTGVNTLGSADLFCASGSNNFTVATGIRFAGASTSGAGTICARQEGTGAVGKATSTFFLHVASDGRLLVRLRGQDNLYDVLLRDQEWHSIVVTWNGTVAALYFDGVAQVAPAVGAVAENTVDIFIAGSSLPGIVGPPTSNLVGQLDDFRVYSRALSASEVSLYDLYIRPDTGGGGDVQLEDLELWLQYEDDLLDSSVNLRHQTANLVNGPLVFVAGRVGTKGSDWVSASSQHIATGVTAFGNCTLFSDASNDFTVAVWVKNDIAAGGIGMVTARKMSTTGFRLQVINGGANVTLRGQLNNYTLTGNDDGAWHHYAVTWNGTAAAFYYDGVAQSVPTNGTDTEGSEQIYIGTVDTLGSGAGLALFFDEHMDDLRFYSRALAAGDVTDLFNNSELDRFDVTIETASIAGGVITINVTFETAVTTFVAGDINVTNGTAGTPTGSGTSWSFTVTPTDDNTVTVVIPVDGITADDGRLNNASNTLVFAIGGTEEGDNTGLLQFDRTAAPVFAANAVIGPIRVSPNACTRSIIQKARHIFGSGTNATGNVNIAVGTDGEDAITRLNDNAHFSTTIAAIENNHGNTFPRLAGHALVMEIDTTTGHLTFEQSTIELKPSGANRGARHVP